MTLTASLKNNILHQRNLYNTIEKRLLDLAIQLMAIHSTRQKFSRYEILPIILIKCFCCNLVL